jgi:alginate O-acetyltransferase complex protein AlgI
VLGLQRFVIGLAKKVLIANTMASVADKVFAIDGPGLSTGLAWIGLIAYTLQIYFDFSGYSCMAVGLGRMLGFDFPENFNYPYVSRSIRAFWQRWHISLSTWFRDYLYIPLGGSRHGSIRTYLNLFIVFLICGLWHGASWNFVVWGLFHGFFLVAERMAIGKWLGFLPMFISRSYVILVVMVGWVFFRTDDLSHAFEFIKVLFGSKSNGHHLVAEYMYADTWILMAAGILFSMPVVPHLLTFVNGLSGRRSFLVQTAYMLSLFILFLFCVMDLVSGSYNPFIYFRF